MRRFGIKLLLLITVLSCAGCSLDLHNNSTSQGNLSLPPEPNTTDHEQNVQEDRPQTPPQKIVLDGQPVTYDKFPIPTADTFNIPSEYADLYEAAVSKYNTIANAVSFSDDSTDMIFACLRLWDTYEDEDGNTVYVANFMQRDFYDLGNDLSDLDNPIYNYGSGGTLAAFTLDKEGNLVNFQKSPDGSDDPYRDYRLICGPLTDLADYFCDVTDVCHVEPINIPNLEPEEMVKQYLHYFFVNP